MSIETIDQTEKVKPGIAQPSVSVCFPAYNERATIETVLRDADLLLSKSGLDYEIVVCDDGSNDGTAQAIASVIEQIPSIRLIRHEQNRGIRDSFEHLYAEAAKDFVFLNSTDQQWETSVLLELLPLTNAFDIMIASRKDKHYGLTRRLISWAFNALPRVLFGVRTYDAGAVKLVRREVIERFHLVSRSPFSEAERLIRASRAGYRIGTCPVATRARGHGQSSGVRAAIVTQALLDVFRVWVALKREN